MVILRPIALDDLDGLVALTSQAGYGLTSLPKDAGLLERRIRESLRGFSASDEEAAHGESYLFVLEDLTTGKIIGTCGIVSKVGGFEPFYAYRVETSVHESQTLKVHKEVRVLHLVAEHNGPCEIGSLFLDPAHRRAGNGRLLSLGRFLLMAQCPGRFDPIVIAELRGVIDERGGSVFWDAVGHHFFDTDFPTVDHLSFVNKRFIAELMPRHPIYIPLLPPQAQAVIGQVHEMTAPARRLLEQEGFGDSGMVDIFEAGPVIICHRDRIRTVCQSKCVEVVDICGESIESAEHVIAAVEGDFRATKGALEQVDGGVRLWTRTALALGVKVGQQVRVAPLRREKPSSE